MKHSTVINPKESPVLQLGVIGFGKLGLLHAAIVNVLPGCRLAAVVDNSSKLLSIFQDWKPDVRCFSTHNEMLENMKLDGVIIATPTHLHVPIARDCIRKGIPIFIEKPLAIDSAQARELMEALPRDAPLPTMVGYMNRFNDMYQKAHSVLKSGVLGRCQTFRATMYISQLMAAGKGWRYDKKMSGGGVLVTQNCHLLDLLLWMFGEVEWVSAHTRNLYSKQVEDLVHCYMSFENGLSGWIDTSWSVRHHRTLTTSIEVQGENGTLQFSDDEVRLFLDSPKGDFAQGWTTFQKPDLFQGVSFDVAGPYYTRQMEAFVGAVREKTPIESDVSSAFRVQCLMDAIYKSAEGDGRRTALELS